MVEIANVQKEIFDIQRMFNGKCFEKGDLSWTVQVHGKKYAGLL